MIERDQLHFVQIRNFVQFLRDVHLIRAILDVQRRARNLDVLIVINREVVSITGTGAERCNT